MELKDKEVYFYQYCEKCKYWKTDSSDDPCNDCLAKGYNEYSHKPVFYKEQE